MARHVSGQLSRDLKHSIKKLRKFMHGISKEEKKAVLKKVIAPHNRSKSSQQKDLSLLMADLKLCANCAD